MDKKKDSKNTTPAAKNGQGSKKKDRLESSLRANLLRRKQQPKPKK
jgi:hypothetical protein